MLHGEMDALERTGRRPASVYREWAMEVRVSETEWLALVGVS